MKSHRFVIAAVAALFLVCAAPPRAALADRARTYETQHYRIWTDVDGELASDIAKRMDAMYEEYARRFSGFASAHQHEKLEVRIFERRADYVKYTGDRLPHTGGIFIPGRKLLAVFQEGQGRDGLRRTLQHEAFHQFAHSVIGGNVPIWLNEGLAQVFEEAIWTGKGFMVGQVPPRRLRQLQQDMRNRKLIEFKTLLALTEKQWAEGLRDRDRAGVQYNQAWAMAHFLVYAQGEDGKPLYRNRLLEMLRLCQTGEKPDVAFTRVFSDNHAGFQKRFVEFARGLRPTVEAAYIENQGVLADLLTVVREDGKHPQTIQDFRQELIERGYRLQYTRGGVQWTTAEDVNVYFTDPRGQLMSEKQLFFENRWGSPMPDIVCKALENVEFQTRFYSFAGKTEYEVLTRAKK